MKGFQKGWATAAATLVLTAAGLAQGITVNVNGQPVAFPGVGPQQVNGRVMVPLRGVMEQLGAYVGYDAATHTVTATRGDIDLQLKLGDRVAMLNGRQVTLDVPAMEYRGSTLVPLRFMGEALGADVRWDGAVQAVNITTSDSTGRPLPIDQNPPPVVNTPVEIRSFTADREGFLRAGGIVTYTLEGTPGATATLEIPGVTQEVQMTEVSPGRYQAQVSIPEGSIAVNRAAAIGRLKLGATERLIQSGNPVSVDTEIPRILDVSPSGDTRTSTRQPNITAVLDDAGSGIDPSRVQILLDDRDVTREATVTGTFLAYRPASPLEPGRHEVVLNVEDRAGNQTRRTWTFNVGRRADTIRSFTSDLGTNPQPGQVVHFTLVGAPGGVATLDIPGRRNPVEMRETTPGHYVAEYTVRRDDDWFSQDVIAHLRTSEGETYNTDPYANTGTRDRAVRRPTITSPTPDISVSDGFRVSGAGPRNGLVRIKVDYRTSVLGLINNTGTLSEQTVEVDDQGHFVSEPIRIGGFASGRGTTYTITATSVGRNGRESDPITIQLRR